MVVRGLCRFGAPTLSPSSAWIEAIRISTWGVTPLVFAQSSGAQPHATSSKPPTAVLHGKNFGTGSAAVMFGNTSATGTAAKTSVTIGLPGSSSALSGPFAGRSGVDVSVSIGGVSDQLLNGYHYAGLPQIKNVTVAKGKGTAAPVAAGERRQPHRAAALSVHDGR